MDKAASECSKTKQNFVLFDLALTGRLCRHQTKVGVHHYCRKEKTGDFIPII